MFNKIKSNLGFTDNIKNPRRAKVEYMLNDTLLYKNNIYNKKGFIITVMLKEKRFPRKEENCQHYKTDGTLTKPKTEYYLSDNEFCNEINKTEYDFAMHLIENNLITEEEINHYIEKENERIRIEEEKQKKEEKRKEEERINKEKEISEINKTMSEYVISDEERKIAYSIFEYYYETTDDRCLGLIPYIRNYDNEYCRNIIKQRLHNDNVASIKLFECITGLKLPNGHKKIIEYLDSISSKDFIGIKEFKPRKKSEKKEVKLESVYILDGIGTDNELWRKFEAECFKKYGIDFFIIKTDCWKIYSKRIGFQCAFGETKQKTIENLRNSINSTGIEKYKKIISDIEVKLYKKECGINPLYRC